jgi:TRAP-type mannitol/chloroaromatic compound transport system substrate-binding protein
MSNARAAAACGNEEHFPNARVGSDRMDRRAFFSRAAVSGAGAAAALGSATVLAQAPTVKWRLQNAYPRSMGDVYSLYDALPKQISAMSGDRFQVQMFQAGELVPAPGILSAVGKGTVEAAFTVAFFHIGVDRSFAFVTGLPFGMNARLQYAWYRYGGGKEVLQELFDQHNIVHFAAGNSGVQMGGFFRKEIKGVADLDGLKMRIGGLGGEVLAAMGVVPQQIAPGEIYSALEKGTIDAVEFGMPVIDEKFGFHKVAPYYYSNGFWDVTNQSSIFVNKERWNELPDAFKETFAVAAGRLHEAQLPYFDANNPAALARMMSEGAQLRAMPRDILNKGYEAAFDLYATEANRNPLFKKIYTQWSHFREEAYRWNSFNEIPLDQYVTSKIAAARKG